MKKDFEALKIIEKKKKKKKIFENLRKMNIDQEKGA